MDSRNGWSNACNPYPHDRWIGNEVFVVDAHLLDFEGQEHVGCKIMREDIPGNEPRMLAIAFGVKYDDSASESTAKCADWGIRVGAAEMLENLTQKSTVMQMQCAGALLEGSIWSHEPEHRWIGETAGRVYAERTDRMGQDLYIITARMSPLSKL